MSEMTADVIEASEEDIVKSVRGLLDSCGHTLEELREMAATGNFDTLKSRLAWVVVGGFHGTLGD